MRNEDALKFHMTGKEKIVRVTVIGGLSQKRTRNMIARTAQRLFPEGCMAPMVPFGEEESLLAEMQLWGIFDQLRSKVK
jgi:hypothetical protein